VLNSRIYKLLVPVFLFAAGAYATDDTQAELQVQIYAVDNDGAKESIGFIDIRPEGNKGLEFRPNLKGLVPGIHGFHIHENSECGPTVVDGEITPAGGAGEHLDPHSDRAHAAPWQEGHLGDLPALYVTEEGIAAHPVFKPGITLDDIRNHALVIHESGDTYTSEPDSSGGGGARVACGVVPSA
jgi:superoxide dismutase, Cu-Zn family